MSNKLLKFSMAFLLVILVVFAIDKYPSLSMPTGWENSLSIFYLLGAGVLLFLGMLRNYKGAYLLTVFFAVWVFGNGASLLLPNLFGNLYFRFLSNNIASVLFVIQIIFSV